MLNILHICTKGNNFSAFKFAFKRDETIGSNHKGKNLLLADNVLSFRI